MHVRAISLAILVLSALAGRAGAEPLPPPVDGDVVQVPAAPAPQLTVPLQLALRERRLERELEVLGDRGSARLPSAIVQLTVGAALTTVGAVLKNEIGRSLLILVGAGTMAHGSFLLLLHEDAASLAHEYRSLPMMTRELAEARVRFGERALQAIARGARRGRIADGTVSMTIATVYVPLLWWLERRENDGYRFGDAAFDYVALALSGINFASGLVTALVRSDAERRLEDYEALRARVSADNTGDAARLTPTLSLVPTRAGAVLAGGLAF